MAYIKFNIALCFCGSVAIIVSVEILLSDTPLKHVMMNTTDDDDGDDDDDDEW